MFVVANDRFSGYAKDMLTAIAHHLNLTFTMQLVPDGSTGRALENGSWTGMIGMLMTNVGSDSRVVIFSVSITYN